MLRFYIKHSGNTFRYKRFDKAAHRTLGVIFVAFVTPTAPAAPPAKLGHVIIWITLDEF